MLKKLQALKAKKGFTLVELIVVIAIIAVLAAILVPTLLNQVTNSRIVSADSTASTIKDAIDAWIVEQNANEGYLMPDSVKDDKVEYYTGTKSAITSPNSDFKDPQKASLLQYLNDAYNFTDTDNFSFVIKDHKVKAVAYCSTKAVDDSVKWDGSKWAKGGEVNSTIVGTYPKYKETTSSAPAE